MRLSKIRCPLAFFGDGPKKTGHLPGDVEKVPPWGVRNVPAGLFMKGHILSSKAFLQPGQTHPAGCHVDPVPSLTGSRDERGSSRGVPHAPVEDGEQDGLRGKDVGHFEAGSSVFLPTYGQGKIGEVAGTGHI